MLEMKIKIEAPDLVRSIAELLHAMDLLSPNLLGPDAPGGKFCPTLAPTTADSITSPAPAPVIPVSSGTPAVQTTPAAVPTPPVPEIPVTDATYTLDQISKAGATLIDMGKMDALLALLGKYGIAAVTQLQPAQYGTFATELRALGAQI